MPTPIPLARPITVSIVSHRQLALVQPLLAELDLHSHASVAKVILTLNVPEADALQNCSWRFPVERIENSVPLGFGGNHNQAFLRCSTPWFLVLNPDIRLESDVLSPMLAQALPESGLMTPRILEPGKTTPEEHRSIITPLEILMRRRAGYSKPVSPAWIPGLFMLFRREAYEAVQGFDDRRFFMYGEDFDICARMQLAGWRLQVAENLRALHDARRASHSSRQHLYWHLSSLLKIWTSPVFWRYRRFARQ